MIYLNRTIRLILVFMCDLGLCFLDIDEFRELKYGIEINRKPVILSHLPQDNVVHLSSKYGQLYQCNLPLRETQDSKSEDDSADNTNITVKSILDDAFANQCLYYNLGWWTYKVCYKKEVTQYHEDNGIIQGNIINLGSFESEKEWNNTNSKRNPNKEEYHPHFYINGSTCELVGKQRQTTVKFVCSDDSSNQIKLVDEPETCMYSITVGCKDLCMHPLFKPSKKESVKEITCSPAISKDQYDEYLKKEQELLLKKKKAEEEKLANAKKQKGNNKVEILMQSLDSFVSGFTSFITKPLVSTIDESKGSTQEKSKDDLSNFWKDFGYNPEASSGPSDSGKDLQEGDKNLQKDPVEGPGAVKDELKNSPEVNEISADNSMSKGDGMLSTEGQFAGRDAKSAEQGLSKINENVKRLISLQNTINGLNKQAATLIRKDREKRRKFMRDFHKSKRKVEKQIGEFKKLMNDLRIKKSKESDRNIKGRLEKLIRRVGGNIKKYKSKLSLLEAKVKQTLKKSIAFETSYKDLLKGFPLKHSSIKKDVPGRTTLKSLNQVIRELRAEKDNKDTTPVAKSENKLTSDEESNEKTQDADKVKIENLDPLLQTLLGMLKLPSKKEKPDTNEHAKEETDSIDSVKEDSSKTSESKDESLSASKSSEENLEKDGESRDGSIKVRVSRLDSEESKFFEESEKQEELSGMSNSKRQLNRAGKKIEDIIKKKLKKAGVNIGANIKIKIITNEGPLASKLSNSKTEFLTDETATQFKDLLVNMLGGGAEKVKEEKRQLDLEDNYKFVWNKEDGIVSEERTDSDESDRDPFFMKNNL